MRWILPYIAPFLCSLLWFCCKPFAAHGAKPPNVGLSSCLPALSCKGRVCTCPNPMQCEGSAGTRELEMLQSVMWKNRDWNPQLKVFLSPHCAVRFYYFLCSASLQPALFLSLTFLLLYSTGKLLWLGKEQWETAAIRTLPLYMLWQLKGRNCLKWKPPCLHFATTHSHNLQPGKQLLHMGHWFISYHALVRQPWTEVEARKMASAIRGP